MTEARGGRQAANRATATVTATTTALAAGLVLWAASGVPAGTAAVVVQTAAPAAGDPSSHDRRRITHARAELRVLRHQIDHVERLERQLRKRTTASPSVGSPARTGLAASAGATATAPARSPATSQAPSMPRSAAPVATAPPAPAPPATVPAPVPVHTTTGASGG